MSESPEVAELRAEVSALSAIVAALFASQANLTAQGNAEWLARYGAFIAEASGQDQAHVAALVSRIAEQAKAANVALIPVKARA